MMASDVQHISSSPARPLEILKSLVLGQANICPVVVKVVGLQMVRLVLLPVPTGTFVSNRGTIFMADFNPNSLSLATHQEKKEHHLEGQPERLDMNYAESRSIKASEDLTRNDDFDQGLEDDDLLALTSTGAILQTQNEPQVAQQGRVKICGRCLPPITPATLKSHRLDPTTTPNHMTETITYANSSSPRRYADFELLMDGEEEEEMLKFSKFVDGLKGSFTPPESAGKAFIDLAEKEVYKNAHHFLNPGSETSRASPFKVACESDTDKIRTNQNPDPGKASSSLEKGKELSFARFAKQDEAGTTCHIFQNPHTATSRGTKGSQSLSTLARRSLSDAASRLPLTEETVDTSGSIIGDSHGYEPLKPFARPNFPSLVLDPSPVAGLSSQTYLRTCFRIGEMFKEGIRCATLGQDAVIE